MLYRVLRNIRTGGGAIVLSGAFLKSDSYAPESLAKLCEVGAIAPLHAPPLMALPGYELIAERLAPAGIINADQLLECDIDMTARQTDTPASTLRKWQAEVTEWLTIPSRAGG